MYLRGFGCSSSGRWPSNPRHRSLTANPRPGSRSWRLPSPAHRSWYWPAAAGGIGGPWRRTSVASTPNPGGCHPHPCRPGPPVATPVSPADRCHLCPSVCRLAPALARLTPRPPRLRRRIPRLPRSRRSGGDRALSPLSSSGHPCRATEPLCSPGPKVTARSRHRAKSLDDFSDVGYRCGREILQPAFFQENTRDLDSTLDRRPDSHTPPQDPPSDGAGRIGRVPRRRRQASPCRGSFDHQLVEGGLGDLPGMPANGPIRINCE
jgi:hypothetical protein